MLEKVEGRGKNAKYLIRKDKVKVPENLPEGDYVLSFRWNIIQSNLSFIIKSQVGCGVGSTSVGLLCLCKTCLRFNQLTNQSQLWVSCAFVKLI